MHHIAATVETDPDAKWILVCDQLNTHKSESLVKAIAEWCGIDRVTWVKKGNPAF